MKKITRIAILLFVVLGLSACNEQPPSTSKVAVSDARTAVEPAAVAMPLPVGRKQDSATLMRGGKLYQDNCAVCHGAQAQGAANWQRKGADGKLPPPPLDASGHAWHHPASWLRDMIKQGSISRGGNMPSWEGKLSDDDIEAVNVWIQSRWPDEIYQSWLTMDKQTH